MQGCIFNIMSLVRRPACNSLIFLAYLRCEISSVVLLIPSTVAGVQKAYPSLSFSYILASTIDNFLVPIVKQ